MTSDLEPKQSEMKERWKKKRSRQNSRNARGPRSKEVPILRGTRRDLEDLIRDHIASAAGTGQLRYICYLVYACDCRARGEAIKTMKEFFEYLPEEKDPNGLQHEITIREPELSRSEQDVRAGETISLS